MKLWYNPSFTSKLLLSPLLPLSWLYRYLALRNKQQSLQWQGEPSQRLLQDLGIQARKSGSPTINSATTTYNTTETTACTDSSGTSISSGSSDSTASTTAPKTLSEFPQHQLQTRVVVVGNLSVGGTGKTPIVRLLVEHFSKLYRVAVISRGYGGKLPAAQIHVLTDASTPAIAGDEMVMQYQHFARVFKGTDKKPILIVGSNRVQAALKAQELGAELIIADDGLQHYRLPRHLEVCVVGTRGFGNGWLLPAGPMRESPERLRDLDLVLHWEGTALDTLTNPDLQALVKTKTGTVIAVNQAFIPLKSTTGLAASNHHQADASTSNQASLQVDQLESQNTGLSPARFVKQYPQVALLSGIGNPEGFQARAQACGLEVIDHLVGKDHQDWQQAQLDEFVSKLTSRNATATTVNLDAVDWGQEQASEQTEKDAQLSTPVILTTEKDAVKLMHLQTSYPIFYLQLTALPSPLNTSWLTDLEAKIKAINPRDFSQWKKF